MSDYIKLASPMEIVDFAAVSACRHCRFYKPEGRRGGQCQQLDVPVQSQWRACSLAVSPFHAERSRTVPQLPWEALQEVLEFQEAKGFQETSVRSA